MTLSGYFKIRNYGLVESIVVLYPILKQYSAFLMSLGDWALFLAALGCYAKSRTLYKCNLLMILVIYIISHEIIVAITMGGAPMYMVNSTIDKVLPLVLIMLIIPRANFEKIKTAFFVTAAICMVGLLYHFIQIFAFGNPVSPITLPFLNMSIMQSDVYLDQIRLRPVSFFAEPAAYAAYMLFPLALCLIEKKLTYAFVISLMTLLSTSSNGFFQTGILWAIFLLSDKQVKTRYKLILLGVIAVVIYYVLSSELFASGIEKIQSIEIESDDRISAGFYTYMNLPFFERLFGVLAASPYDYIIAHPDVIRGVNISMKDDTVYLPMIWFYAIKFGFICVILVLTNVFKGWKYVELRPFVITSCVGLFVQSVTIVMPMFLILLYIRTRHAQLKDESSIYCTISCK